MVTGSRLVFSRCNMRQATSTINALNKPINSASGNWWATNTPTGENSAPSNAISNAAR